MNFGKHLSLRKRPITLAIILIISAPMLTGCLTMRADLKINDKALATGNYHLEINKVLGALVGMTSTETTLKLLTDGENVPKGASFKVTENDLSYIIDGSVKDAVLDEEGNTVKVLSNGDVEFNYVTEANPPPSGMEDFPGYTDSYLDFNIEMPGKIKSISGIGQDMVKKISDRKFSIHDDAKTALNLVIVSSVDKSLVSKIISVLTQSTITCVKSKTTKK